LHERLLDDAPLTL